MSSLYRYADTNGDGTGTKNAIGNYSVTPQRFNLTPPAGEVFRVERMLISVSDSGTFDADKYGNGIALTNGVTVEKRDANGQIIDYCDGVPVVNNTGWAQLCYDKTIHSEGVGAEIMTIRWTFSKGGAPVTLIGDQGEFLSILLNDDFTGLISHYFFLHGRRLSGPDAAVAR